ncbi:hypothetical protein PG996_015213 [Apiospora saccharicola]|uniref:Uncharacterized protein n=1 Tax=Apiospora saccharicola TaxID=335842 RepID=A0ABR1TN65_9PEZI
MPSECTIATTTAAAPGKPGATPDASNFYIVGYWQEGSNEIWPNTGWLGATTNKGELSYQRITNSTVSPEGWWIWVLDPTNGALKIDHSDYYAMYDPRTEHAAGTDEAWVVVGRWPDKSQPPVLPLVHCDEGARYGENVRAMTCTGDGGYSTLGWCLYTYGEGNALVLGKTGKPSCGPALTMRQDRDLKTTG